jgi:hypothetical protein
MSVSEAGQRPRFGGPDGTPGGIYAFAALAAYGPQSSLENPRVSL